MDGLKIGSAKVRLNSSHFFPFSRSFLTRAAYHLVKHSRSSRLNAALKVRSSGCNSPVQLVGTKV